MSLTVADLSAKLGLDTSGFDRGIAGVANHKGFADIGKKTADTGKKMTMGLTLPIVAVGAVAVNMAAKFETSMNQVQAASGASAEEMKGLSAYAMKMGADTMFSAGEAGQAMLDLSKGGMTAAQIKAGGLAASLDLAAAGDLELAQAAEVTIQAMGMFNLKAKDAGAVADALAGGANASTASVEGLALALSQVGPGAGTAGLSLQQTVAVLAEFADKGIQGSDAGTSLKTMLSNLVPQTDKARHTFEQLGISFTNADGSFKSISEIAQILQDKMGGLSAAERTATMAIMFGSDATRAATILMKGGAEGLVKYTKATNDKEAADRMADARTKGLAGAMESLKGSVETVAISLSQVAVPAMTVIAKKITGVVNAFTGLSDTQKKWVLIAAGTAAAAGPVLVGLGKVAQGVAVAEKMYRGLRVAILGTTVAQEALTVAQASGARAGAGASVGTGAGAAGGAAPAAVFAKSTATFAGSVIKLAGAVGLMVTAAEILGKLYGDKALKPGAVVPPGERGGAGVYKWSGGVDTTKVAAEAAKAAKAVADAIDKVMAKLGASAATATGPAFDRIRTEMTNISTLAEEGFEFGDLKADKTDGQLRSLRDKIQGQLDITRKAADRIMAAMFKDWRPQDNVKPKINAAMADVEARIDKMRANAMHEIRFGDLKNGLVLAKIADTEARQAQLRAKLASNIAAGKLDNGPLVTKIAATGVKLDALRGKIKDPIAAGKIDTNNWMNSIAKAQEAFRVWKISLSGKLTVGNLVMPSPPASGYGGGGGPATGERAQIVAAATSRVGDPYVWSGSSPGGFDCSGLMSWAYQSSGDSITRVPTYSGRAISRGQIQPADIMFYNPNAIQNGVRVPFGHFKMYIGDNKTVESTTGGVQIRTADWAGAAAIHTYLARGGIATSPSIVGEAGPEAVIPLTNARRGAAVLREAGLLPGGEGAAPVIHEHYYVQLPGGSAIVGNAEDVGRQIAPAVGRQHNEAAAARARSR